MTVFKENKIPIIYPSSDGKRMAENTIQFDWIVKIKEGLEETTQNQDIFIAGDLLWYPVEGDNKTRLAPDVMAALGRPKGDRSSYLQWREGNIPPQIVFEILSPGNRRKEMENKLAFYEKYGVKEYILYYPQKNRLTIYEQRGSKLEQLPIPTKKWISTLLNITLHLTDEELKIYHPNGQLFKSPLEISKERNRAIKNEKIAKEEAEIAKEVAEIAKEAAEIAKEETGFALNKAELAIKMAEKERAEKELLAQKLRELGINPNELLG